MSTISPDSPLSLTLEPTTQAALNRFSRRRRGLLWIRAIAAAAVTLILCMLLVAGCDFLFFLPDTARWLMSVGGYVLALFVMWWQGLRHLRENDPRNIARRLETAAPKLREDLLSAVELADPELVNGSAGFRDRLQRRVAQRLNGIDIGRLLPLELIRRWVTLGLLAFSLCLALLLIPQMQFGRRIARAMLPGIAIERASLTEVTIIKPSPASGYVAEGDAVGIVVSLSGAPADFVQLRWRTDEGVEGETEMTARVAVDSERTDGTLTQSETFAANVSVGSVPLHYQVRAGDAITLWHTLKPLPRPRVASFEKRYVFPHYAKLADRVEQAEHGDLKAIVGTIAEVTVRFDEPVENAFVRFANHGIEIPLEAADGSLQEFTTTIPVKTPGQYQVDATSSHSGLNNPFSPQYSITPVIDAAPVARWTRGQIDTTLVSPLDVVSLQAIASDDLPLDRVVQEYIVNAEPMRQRDLGVAESGRELELHWEWDLMRLAGEEAESRKLTSGDIIRTRTVAIDRRGNRGESRWIEFFIADEGFDVDRHAQLKRLAQWTGRLSRWALDAKELGKQIASLNDKDAAQDVDTLQVTAESLHGQKETLLQDLHGILQSTEQPPLASSLELIGRALIHQDQKITQAIERWIAVRQIDHPDWSKSSERALKSVASEGKRISTESTRLDQLARSNYAMQLTVGALADGLSLHRSLRPLLDEENKMPVVRFPRYLTVAIGRLEAIGLLLREYEAALPDSTTRHYEAWDRWSGSWESRLADVIETGKEAERRNLVRQFESELDNQIAHSMVDGQVVSTLNNMLREVQKQVGPVSDQLRSLTKYGESLRKETERAKNESDSAAAANLNRDIKLSQSDWDRTLGLLRSRLAAEADLHRSRQVVDLQFAADTTLLDRAIENVTQQGFQDYREEPAAQVHQKLANAFQMIESMHHADGWASELAALLLAERRLESHAHAKVIHPWWLERFSIGIEWPLSYLRNLNLPWEEFQPIDQPRYSEEFNEARNSVTSRRWTKDEYLTADAPLTALVADLTAALDTIQPRVVEARVTIQKYVLTLPEQARKAAEKAEEAEARTEQRENSESATARELATEQTEAEDAAEEIVQSLIDLANTSDISDEQQRELARDADAAAAKIEDAVEQAREEMKQAKQAESAANREKALDRTAEALNELASALNETADHFEAAENGEDVSESRQALRDAEAALEIEDQLEQRFDEAEQLSQSGESSPEELMQQLEQELQTNQPMRQELSEIAQKATEAAQRTLEQAAKNEKSLNQALERSDPVFQEKKRQLSRQLTELASRAATVDQAVLSAAENSIGWANQPETRPELQQARAELRDAAQNANQLGGDNALLSDMQQAAREMAQAIENAQRSVENVRKQTEQGAENDVHEKDSARQQAKQQVERFERDARNRRAQAANNEKRNWDAAERDAKRRVQQAQRQKRDAETAKRRLEDKIKREPKNAEGLRPQVAEQQRRVDAASRAEAAAKETERFADEKGKQTDQRIKRIQQTKTPPLDKPNPAAQLASRMSEQAGNELDAIKNELNELANRSQIEQELRAPQAQAEQFTRQQQQIQANVADAAEQLQRAARHESRLGQEELSQQLNEAAAMIAENAAEATAQAEAQLQQASEDSGQTPQASQKVEEATAQLQQAADALAQMSAAAEASASAEAQSGEAQSAGQEQAEGQQMAQTLDELDRAMAQSQPGESQPGQSQPGESPSESQQAENGQPGEGQQPGESSGNQPGQPTAAQASPTLAQAIDAQAQQAARQRQQQLSPTPPPGPGEGEGQQQASSVPGEGTEPGSGEMPGGGAIDVAGVERLGAQWGQLRERRTEDATESQDARVAPQYRREVEAYFRAVARRAAEKSQ